MLLKQRGDGPPDVRREAAAVVADEVEKLRIQAMNVDCERLTWTPISLTQTVVQSGYASVLAQVRQQTVDE
jgi:hypothetical protein